MDAGPDALRGLAFADEPVLGASSPGELDLGPISPELALVDPALAERARQLLPEPRERAVAPRRLPAAPALEPPAPVEAPPVLETPRRRRWPRAVALAVVIFVAGAASGSFLGNNEGHSPDASLEAAAVSPKTAPARPESARPKPARPKLVPTGNRAALRPPKLSRRPTRARTAAAPAQRRRHARIAWAANVLGVAAGIDQSGVVTLMWQRPVDSERVVVLRTRMGRGKSVVVYRGRATRYRDASPHACAVYRYTIVNYDRRGDRSTGVPTSVVTRCA